MTPTSATPRRGHQDFLLIATVAETVSAFSTIERRLICYLRALWGQPVAFREADEPRVSIVQGDIRMPCQLRVGAGGDGVTLYRAAAAHAPRISPTRPNASRSVSSGQSRWRLSP